MKLGLKNADMSSDKLFVNILRFAIPIMITGLLQRLYNAADVIVVGRFAGQTALAGVGTTGVIVDFLLNFFIGLSTGVAVVIGRALGAKDDDGVSRIVHTSMTLSAIAGVVIAFVCVVFAKPLLGIIDVPPDVMPQAKIYMQIVAIGHIPALIYNFATVILRANGDTKRPLYVVMFTGVVNVVLNLFFVIVLNMKADGVALATVIANLLNAAAVVYMLRHETSCIRLDFSKLGIDKEKIKAVLADGVPGGISSSVFSIANVIIQKCINGFGSAAIAGSAAASNVLTFYLIALNGFSQASAAFVSYNLGAKKYAKINKVVLSCFGCAGVIWAIEIIITLTIGNSLVEFYIPGNAEALRYGSMRMITLGLTYGFCGLMNAVSGALRGIGHSFKSMLISLVGVCGVRLIWIYAIFPLHKTYGFLLVALPLSWLITFLVSSSVFIYLNPARRMNGEMFSKKEV